MADPIQVPVSIQRSGFLSQVLSGKAPYATRPPRLFEDFGMSVIALSDTSADSHRILQSLKKVKTENGKLDSVTGSSTLKIENETIRATYAFGVGPFDTYYNHKNKPNEHTNFYEIFSSLRIFLFGIFKFADYIIRTPALIFATGQILLERIGWKLQALYKKTNHPALKPLAGISAVIGFALNATGAVVFRSGVFVSKILAEAIRLPLAILGGVVGLVFGGVVSIFQTILTVEDKGSDASVKSVSNSIFQGMIDGIRPFAPEFANELQRIWLQTEMGETNIRWPFQHGANIAKEQEISKDTVISPHWLPIAMFMLSIVTVSILGTVNVGMNQPLLEYLFDLTRVTEGGAGPLGHFTFMKLNPELAATAYVTFGLMAVGGLKTALVGLVRGVQAFFNDCVGLVKKKEDVKIIGNSSTAAISINNNSDNVATSNGNNTPVLFSPNLSNNSNNTNDTSSTPRRGK